MSMRSAVTGQPRIDSEKIFTFPQGIPGFEEYTTFKIFHKDDNAVSAYWLESCDSPAITFTLVDPTEYDLNYDLYLSDTEQETLKATDPMDIGIFLMLVKPEDDTQQAPIGAHIGGPLVLNVPQQLGLQKVLGKTKVNVNIVAH
ncbi:MAG: flagellar assembly protein FliW [Desulfocapsaceae bacterium]|nr:flagellar assembly protein FliW [Desulfocapsaceae bacterium]